MKKKLIAFCLSGSLLLATGAMLTPASARQEAPPAEGQLMAKLLINIEGTVTAVEGKKITLDNGKIILITPETRFEDDPDNGIEAVCPDILVGNYIQGFTLDDPTGKTLTADAINTNVVPNDVQLPNPWQDCETLKEAETVAGFAFPLTLDKQYQKGYTEISLRSIGNKLMERNFQKGEHRLTFRKGNAQVDVSGDYNNYVKSKRYDLDGVRLTLNGGDKGFTLAVWTAGQYGYSIQSTRPLPERVLLSLTKDILRENPPVGTVPEECLAIGGSFVGTLEECDGMTALLRPVAGEAILASGDLVSIPFPQDFPAGIGDKIRVFYDTNGIMESYPLQVNVVTLELAESESAYAKDGVIIGVSPAFPSELSPALKQLGVVAVEPLLHGLGDEDIYFLRIDQTLTTVEALKSVLDTWDNIRYVEYNFIVSISGLR